MVRSTHMEYFSHLEGAQEEVRLYASELKQLSPQGGKDIDNNEPEKRPGAETLRPVPLSSRYPAGLTAREIQVLRLLVQGLTNKQIAKELVLSPRTINVHVTSIYNKIGVNSRSAATYFACTYRLIDPY
jgi:DNA-binding NarL/FixJ family response regulator